MSKQAKDMPGPGNYSDNDKFGTDSQGVRIKFIYFKYIFLVRNKRQAQRCPKQ